MIKRKYYPKSHIITGLVTKGNEWMMEDGTEYIGAFHKYIDGLILTGGIFSAEKSQKLIPFKKTTIIQNSIYSKLTKLKLDKYISPKQIRVKPTSDERNTGFFIRYFVLKRNDFKAPIFEINKKQFASLNKEKSGINEHLYFGITMRWKISGPEFDVKNGHIINESGVVDSNVRTVAAKEREMPGILNYLINMREFSVYV